MENNKDDLENQAIIAVDIATEMLMMCEKAKVLPEIAYAAFGNAFTRMHVGLGKTRKDFLDMVNFWAQTIEDPKN